MSSEPKKNSVIADRYKLLELLGKGAKGSVFKASDAAMSRTVAIKLHKKQPSQKDLVRFQLEAKALAKLKHPNIVQVSDFGLHQEQSCYLVMEFLAGRDLSYLIKNKFHQLNSTSILILKQICSAMGHAHEKGVFHRDLKPANVIVQDAESLRPTAKIVDFGLAKLSDDSYITDQGKGVGTPPYMSPEQVQGKKVDGRSDVYSFGCLMYELLTGKLAFKGKTPVETSKMHIEAKAPKLSDANSEIEFDQTLEHIIERCLAKSPEERYQNFEEILSEFEIFESQEQDENTDKTVKIDKKLSTTKLSLAILTLFGVALVSFLVYSLFFRSVEFTSSKEVPPPIKDLKNTVDFEKDRILTEHVCHRPSVTEEGLIKLRQEIGSRKINKLVLNLSQFDGAGLSLYVDLPLKVMSIANSELTDIGLQQISRMKDIRALKLNKNNNLTYKGFAYLSRLPKSFEINLISSKLNDNAMSEIAKFPVLRTLVVTDNPAITSKGWGYLKRLKTLKVLELGQQKLTDQDLEQLGRLKDLKFLRLQQVQEVSDSQIEELRNNLPATKVLISKYARKDLVDVENLLPPEL